MESYCYLKILSNFVIWPWVYPRVCPSKNIGFKVSLSGFPFAAHVTSNWLVFPHHTRQGRRGCGVGGVEAKVYNKLVALMLLFGPPVLVSLLAILYLCGFKSSFQGEMLGE